MNTATIYLKCQYNWLRSMALMALMIGMSNVLIAQVQFSKTNMRKFNPNAGSGTTADRLEDQIELAQLENKALYIPPGSYTLDRQIRVENQPQSGGCADHNGNGSVNIIGDPQNRPTIQLADNTGGFGNSGSPKAVFEIWRPDKRPGQGNAPRPACLYFANIRNLKFDLGSNAGAIAINFPSAQDCDLANIRVTGSNFFAGFTGVPGRNMANVNLEVVGGRYGIYLSNSGSVGFNLFGLKLINQSQNAIYVKNDPRGGAIVGAEISGCPGPAIYFNGGSEPDQAPLTLVDARIEITNSNNFAIDYTNRSVHLRNVFVNGTNKIATGNNRNFTVGGSNWTQVDYYNYTPSSVGNQSAVVWINGTKSGGGQENKSAQTNVSSAPGNFVNLHTPHFIYGFNSSGAVSVTDFGAVSNDGNDDHSAFVSALNSSSSIIYVPKGRYHLSNTIEVPAGKVLIGDPGKKTFLIPEFGSPGSYKYVVRTANSSGFSALQDLRFNTPKDKDYIGAVNWRTEDGFLFSLRNNEGAGVHEKNKRHYAFTGSAGGRVFGIAEHNNLESGKTANTNYRKVYIEKGANPLTFYGLNLERGGAPRDEDQYPFCEVKNSSNVRFFGGKTETRGVTWKVSNSQNIAIYNAFAHINSSDPVIELDGQSNKIELAQAWGVAYTKFPSLGTSGGTRFIGDGDANNGNNINKPVYCGFFAKGNFDHCAFGSCGSGNNNAPTANVGSDATITLPSNSVVLNGSGSDSDGTISSYSWTKISGPAATLSGTNTATLTASDLVAGTYVFQLTVTDDDGATGSDQVTVTVNSSGGCQPGNATETATHALYTENGTKKNNDFLRVENKPDGSRKRITYVQFEVDGTCGTITDAQLRFHVEDNGNGTFRVYKGSHSNWTDNSSVGDLPGKDVQVGSYTGSINSGTFDFDVTPGVTGEGKVTFIVEMDQGGNDIRMSSEDVSSTSLRPKLLLDYGSTAGARVKVNDFPSQSLIPGLVIYPNPNQRRFVIAGLKGTYKVQLLNLAGQALSFNFEETSRGLEVIVPGVGSGVYNLVINTGGDIITKRIVIE